MTLREKKKRNMNASGIGFPLTNKDWQRGGGADLYSTSIFDRGTTGFEPSFNGASNSIKNKTNARGVMQFVAIHQEVGEQKLWKSHFNQPLFRLIEPHDLDHQNFLLMRNEIVEQTFKKLEDLPDARALYYEGPGNNMKFGTYPYGRYQTVPQVNYSLALAQLGRGVALSYADVWSRVRPSGICLTHESAQANADGALGDVRSMLITGPSKMHNLFGKYIEIGWQFGVLIKPVPVTENEIFEYRVTIDGKPVHFPVESCCMPSGDRNAAVERGYIWQLEFYCCPDTPELDEYRKETYTITATPPQQKVIMTGGYIRLGRIHYEHLETKDFFGGAGQGGYTQLRTDASKLSPCAIDMDTCCKAPVLDVFWDPSNQKLY